MWCPWMAARTSSGVSTTDWSRTASRGRSMACWKAGAIPRSTMRGWWRSGSGRCSAKTQSFHIGNYSGRYYYRPMGLLTPVILGALLIVAFALSSQQRLGLASHAGPMPARQIAYLMRAHHQGAISLKQATPGLDTVIDAPPATMTVGDHLFLSCISGKFVA